MRKTTWMALGLATVLAFAGTTAAVAQEGPKLQIGGTTYTKWLWGNQRYDGAMYNFTTVPGEGYGDNGQGSEIELLLNAKLSRQVEVRARLHSRFSQNQWTNFGGFGGGRENCTGGDCGEFDPRSNQYVKLRGVAVVLTPGYKWLDSATIGSNDFGMFDPFVIGRIRYIDRDNASGILLQGSGMGKQFTWDLVRISLPRLWAGPAFNTGNYPVQDAAYGAQFKYTSSPMFDVGGIVQWVNDVEVDGTDKLPDNGRKLTTRFRNTVVGAKFGIHPSSTFDMSAAIYRSSYKNYYDSAKLGGATPPSGFGLAGFSPTLAGDGDDISWKINADMNDPFGVGLSFKAEAFFIGAEYVSMMAARRESDVLLTEGHDSTWGFPGPSNANFGVFGGNATRAGYGGWTGDRQQLATINVDNEFADFDEPLAETAIGWKGFTVVPTYVKGALELSGEYSYIDYDTNWQAWGDPSRGIENSKYPNNDGDTGVLKNWRNAYAPFQDKKTHIAVLKMKYVADFGKGVDIFGKIKHVKETDNRMTDARYLPYAAGDCSYTTLTCGNVRRFYSPGFSTADLYGNPGTVDVNGDGSADGFQWKPFDSLSDDDRDLNYWSYRIGAGYQLTDDLYASIAYDHYSADVMDGNTAMQGYRLHEMSSGDHKKNSITINGKYILAGAEFGFMYQYYWGTFDPDFGGGFAPQRAGADQFNNFGYPVGSPGFSGRFGGWNSLLDRDFKQHRLKAFMKVQF